MLLSHVCGGVQVVANAVAALSEIQESSSRDVFDITSAVLQKLLAALNECTEWGQVQLILSTMHLKHHPWLTPFARRAPHPFPRAAGCVRVYVCLIDIVRSAHWSARVCLCV